MKSGIYSVTSPSGSRYIGSAVNFNGRWRQHRHELKKGKHHNQPLQRACNKYGIASLVFDKILICRPEDILFFEQLAIDGLRPEYNSVATAGSQLGFRHSAESIERIRLAKSGFKHSLETRMQMSRSRTGRAVSDETKNKISKSNSGKVRSDEVRAQIRASRIGKGLSEGAKAKLSVFWKGRKFGRAAS